MGQGKEWICIPLGLGGSVHGGCKRHANVPVKRSVYLVFCLALHDCNTRVLLKTAEFRHL